MPSGVPNRKVNRAMPLWFYLDDQLHRRLKVHRVRDEVEAWNFATQQRVIYSYTALKLRQKVAYTTEQAGKILGRRPLTLLRYIEWGYVKPPAKGVKPGGHFKTTAYRWSDKDILGVHDYMKTLQGYKGPTRREVVAQLNQEEILYVQSDNGFVPTWRAKEF